MIPEIPLLVFTDLDGTLLSHDDYSWEAARPALRRLADIGAGVVLASSKTAAEISVLRNEMGLGSWPAIVENGAGVLPPLTGADPDPAAYLKLREKLEEISASLRGHFRGFGDMSEADVCAVTGLPMAAARLAKTRQYSEPGLWSGTADQRTQFLSALSAQGISARQGGRFLTLSFGGTKADQMAQIAAKLKPRHTIALGDAPNDVEMLLAADYGVIVANPHREPLPQLAVEPSDHIMRTKMAGPDGWNGAILDHLARLNLRIG